MGNKWVILTGLAMVLSIFLMGCGPGEESAAGPVDYTVVREAEIAAGNDVPAPIGPVILTLSGKILNPNVGETLQFDMNTLEQLGLVQYSVDDKQAEGHTAVFDGVLVSDLLAVAGVADDATTLYTVALNDYAVEIPVEDVEKYPVMLATEVDGQRMGVERYGPIRIIYPYDSYDLDETVYDPRWIWQLKAIDVR